jgi:4-hydroxy-tetrahydrodipicolinate synthase
MSQVERQVEDSSHISAQSRPIHGVWSPALVPVQDDFSIDTERFLTHARWLLEKGCHGLALFGTTSEANSFSLKERMGLLEAALGAGITPQQLMVGTGCCALPDSVRLTKHAVDNGCKKVLMLPPFYYKGVSDAGLYRSYAEVIDRVADDELRVLFYHFPKLSGVPITVGLIELLLADYPGIIAGLKDSSGDWSNTEDLIDRFPEMSIFPGSERFLRKGLEHGGAGCITATANVNAAGARAVWNAWADNAETLDGLDARMIAARTAIEAYPVIPAQKFLLARHRNDPQWQRVRPPLLDLDERQGAELLASLAKIDFALD